MNKADSEQRKNLKENGHTPSYIEWVIWQTNRSQKKKGVEKKGQTI